MIEKQVKNENENEKNQLQDCEIIRVDTVQKNSMSTFF